MNTVRKGLLILLMGALCIHLCLLGYTTDWATLESLRKLACADNSSCILFNALFSSNVKGNNEQPTYLQDEFYFAGNHVAMFLQNQTRVNGLPPYKFTIIDWTMYHFNSNWEPTVIGNCLVTRNKTLTPSSDTIAIVLRKLSSLEALPKDRKSWQRWVLILDGSPFHLLMGQPFNVGHLRNMFNWTMTYRIDSDVYLPYGYTFKLKKSQIVHDSLFDNKSQIAAAVISNCNSAYIHNGRFTYIKELSRSMPIVTYGNCGIACAGFITAWQQLTSHCAEITKFKFILAFENSNCREYISEKMFMHGLAIGVVPVVMGARKIDYINLAPPNSFIFADDFKKTQDLAKYLFRLANNKTEYMKFHDWRRHYDVRYRILSYDDLIWAPLCQKLNSVANAPKNQSAKTYHDLASFWKVSSDCDVSRNFL